MDACGFQSVYSIYDYALNAEFKVRASYQGEGDYTLAVDGEDHTHIKASGNIQWEGLDKAGPQSLRLRGVIGDHQVLADVATVGGVIHIFARVRVT